MPRQLLSLPVDPAGRRRLALLVASVVVGVALALLPSRTLAETLFRQTGFWAILGCFTVWILVLVRWFSRLAAEGRGPRLDRVGVVGLALAVLLTAAGVTAARPSYRILADETNLLAVAMGMYEDHTPLRVDAGLYDFGSYRATTRAIDKRPLAYPFLVWLAHTFTGYRAANGFAISALSTAAALFLVFSLGRRVSPLAGFSAMLFLAGCPMVMIWAASCGFEMTNVCFLVLMLVMLERFLASPRAEEAEALVWTVAILAQCRYESAAAIPIVLGVFVFRLPADEWPRLSPTLALVPLLLAPAVWPQRLSLTPHAHQAAADEAVFSAQAFLAHLWPALRCLAGARTEYATSPATFGLALAGLCVTLWRAGRARTGDPGRDLTRAAFWVHGLLALVILGYAHGNLTDPVTMRLALAFVPAMALLAGLALDAAARALPATRPWLLALAVLTLLVSWPETGKAQAVTSLQQHRFYNQVLAHIRHTLAEAPLGPVLVVTYYPNLFSVHRYGALDFATANARAGELLDLLRTGFYQAVFVIEHVPYASDQPDPRTTLRWPVTLVPSYAMRLNDHDLARVMRVSPPPLSTSR